ncbi:hypothetical protein HTVC309P_gp5 [Pelagibacter phage HTVC309P]|nr:hypothetical protein HTVC309P_gp5 [Pelagibacter phage HTVC309P]
MNEYQKRLVNNPVNQGKTGNYLFYGVPNDIEGKLFVKLLRRYINPKFKFYRQFRKSGSWSHSVNSTDGDSFVIYVDDKDKKTLADKYIESSLQHQEKLRQIKEIINN